MKKAIILLSAIMSVMTLTVMADEYIDPQTNVVYTYEPGQPTASVKAGCEMVVDMGLIDLCPGSPDAADDVVILDKFTVGTTEYVVTSIGESAFWYNKNIKSVNIPESVTDIGVAAFENCDGLTAVQLPEGLIRISRKLFHNCSQLESVVIPSSIRSIDEQAFADCRSLASLTLPADLNYIGRYAFQNTPWYSTQYNEAPDGLFYIGPLLVGYKGNVPTGDLVIKEGTTCIGYQAFNYCTGLTSVTIPESLTHIDYRAFYNCVGLTAVHITDLAAWCGIEFQWDDVSSSSNPLFYAHHLYLNGEEVTDLVIPDGVTSIGQYAFDNCTGLTSVTIPNGVTRICSKAFRNCSNLTSVTIPPSVTIIESLSFLWCNNLTAVHISDLAAWCGISFQAASDVFNHGARLYLNGEEVSDLVIPDGVASIGSWSFMNCNQLTSVTIPESVTKIGDNAFYGCSNLTDVYSYGNNVPSLGYDVFKNSLIASATLHVPAGSIEKYKTTSPWSDFGNIVVLSPDLTHIKIKENPGETLEYVGKIGSDFNTALDSLRKLKGIYSEIIKEPLEVIFDYDDRLFFGIIYGDCAMYSDVLDTEGYYYLRTWYSQDETSDPVTYTEGQMATIVLPTEPEAGKGKYYRLDRYEDGQIIFEQELQPQAHIPYIIVPNEDFSIDLSALDLAGCYRDTVSVDGISFIGSYVSETFDYPDGFYIDFIDITPDCRFDESCVIGALRAYLLVRWDDPYNQGGTRVPPLNKRGIVLRDYETGITSPLGETGEATLYDLQGRMLPSKPAQGIYIKNRQKVMVK